MIIWTLSFIRIFFKLEKRMYRVHIKADAVIAKQVVNPFLTWPEWAASMFFAPT